MSRPCAIYQVVHRESGSDYIGVSIAPEKRWKAHLSKVRCGSKLQFHCSLRMHGADAFDWNLIGWWPTQEAALRAEVAILAAGLGRYNMTAGGDGVCNPSPEARRKNADARRGMKRKPHSLATRALMSEKARGRPKSQAARENMRKAHLGVKLGPYSAEHRANISAGNKRNWAENRERRAPGLAAFIASVPHPSGSHHPMAKLSEEQVRAIRASVKSHREIADEYGVSATTIGDIRRYRIWKSVD